MSDQQAPQNGDTPAVAGPEQAPGTAESTPETNWEKRYQDLQPEYTRTTQQLAEQKQWLDLLVTSDDPATQRQALEALGYDVPDEVEDVEAAEYEYDEDPIEQLSARQQAVEEQLRKEQEAREEAFEGQILRDFVDDQLDKLNVTDEDDRNWILAQANNNPLRPPPGVPVRAVPDIQGAYEAFQAWETKRQKQWAQTKRAPFVMPGGQSATEAPDLSTHEGRVANMLRKAEEMRDQA